ncbi:MAG: beta-N-acetylhexosaminidase [Epulopiscium sp.]|nr:beta-N-acetylhexosaminidase [Candidatus Epulonipiscium sp.]
MNLAQKIGQLLVVGFDGTEVNDHIKNMITTYHVGNIILFERNYESPKQLFTLVQDLQKIAIESNGYPLFVTIDQENGIVTRIHDGITVFPGSMAQSAGATIEESRKVAQYTGEGLRALGVNFNLAPSVDINNNPSNPVIGVRSFGETAEQVAERSNAYIEGMQETGVIATAKHFPGHGDTNVDSHLDLPVISHSKERLEKVELYPFKEAIKHGVKAIMSAHIKFPAYEPKDLPGTLSYPILTNLLREELGYEGIVITDCMEMEAIDTYYGTSKATPMAIAAGADLVCISSSEEKQAKAISEIYHALEVGTLTQDRIEQSLSRIMEIKNTYDVDSIINTSYADVEDKLYRKEHQDLARKISNQSITVLKNNGLIPIKAEEIMIIAPSGRVLTGADGVKLAPNFASYFADKVINKKINVIELGDSLTDKEIKDITSEAANKELVIYCTHNATLDPRQIELGEGLLSVNKNLILIPMRIPYDVEKLQGVENCLLPYEYTMNSMDSLVGVLMGSVEGNSKLPVTINI